MQVFQQILKKGNFINGQWQPQGTGETLTVVNKYDQSVMAELPLASEEQMEEAIQSAETAFGIMKRWSAEKRAELLFRLQEELEKVQEPLAELIVAEAGKPIGYARSEAQRCVTTIALAATEATRLAGEHVPMDHDAGLGKTAFTKRFPIGPIACISPFNFPLNLALHKVAPALAIGCSVVLKPAPQAPLSCLLLAALAEKVGYPAGAVNVLVTDIPVAEKMVRDERMKMLSFTGSPQVGWYLKSICGQKKVALELGGNAAVIVDETADLKVAAKTIAVGAYLYAGQICISTQRIYVMDSVFDVFQQLLLKEMEAIQTGDPAKAENMVGPIIDKTHLQRIDSWVQEALQQGAELLSGGKILSEKNNLYAPTLLTNTQPNMKVVQEEVFGPVAILEKINTFQEGIDQINDSIFGLQAGVFTNQLSQMKVAHEQLEVAGVMINNVPGFRVDSMPYGGVKASGLGREGARYVMEEMTEPRLLVY
ncbi:MAG: aldehyde dehydrogenase [SAR324 cluster bacterium]|uniref:Aldehyde dehydrogenase n=1 Tax=SAR324 cluster bacterium TaxID=2024889 RepID=A0A2A4T3F4_9DELT|nr:MAG: aldehyde dehydrogenase [SAR324 cluster bacterium]